MSCTDRAEVYREAARLSLKDGTGLSYLIKQRSGATSSFWYYRDPVLYVNWDREDYVMALCMLAALAESGDLPNGL